jgi:hypothetical protein
MHKNSKTKLHHNGKVVELMGNPEKMINLLIADPASKKWATYQILHNGRKRDQVLKALLLNIYLN